MSAGPERCAVCADAAEVATVLALSGGEATVELAGGPRQVAVDLVAPVAVGDRLLCHAGVAIDRLDPA